MLAFADATPPTIFVGVVDSSLADFILDGLFACRVFARVLCGLNFSALADPPARIVASGAAFEGLAPALCSVAFSAIRVVRRYHSLILVGP